MITHAGSAYTKILLREADLSLTRPSAHRNNLHPHTFQCIFAIGIVWSPAKPSNTLLGSRPLYAASYDPEPARSARIFLPKTTLAYAEQTFPHHDEIGVGSKEQGSYPRAKPFCLFSASVQLMTNAGRIDKSTFTVRVKFLLSVLVGSL